VFIYENVGQLKVKDKACTVYQAAAGYMLYFY